MQIPPGGQEEALAFEISRTSISIRFPKMLYRSLQHTFPSSLWGIYLSGIELDRARRSKSIPVYSTLKDFSQVDDFLFKMRAVRVHEQEKLIWKPL